MRIRCLLLWLSITTVVQSAAELKCPDISTMFVKEDCEDKMMFCEPPKASTDGKSFSCAADTTFEGRGSKKSQWEPIEEVKCELSKDVHFIVAKTKGDIKNIDDYTQFRCVAPVCAVDPAAAFKTFCPTGDDCVKANVNKSNLSCPDTHALETKKADGKWIGLVDNRCVGSKLTSSVHEHEPIEVYGCRKSRGCDLAKYLPSCGLKEKCTTPKESIVPCSGSAEFQASFTDDISWQKIRSTKCIDNRRIATNIEELQIKEIPLALRCVQDAVCEIDITPIYDGSTCTKDVFDLEECFEPEKEPSKSTFKCPGDGVSLMEIHQHKDDAWTLAGDIDCYNDILVDRLTGRKITGLFRCRGKRGNDMANYYVKTECDDRKVCDMPIKVKSSEIAYDCKINKFPWTFQVKFTKSWIDVQSTEFRNDVFVIKDTTGAEKPEIPIQFRCIRDATCKIDPETKFNSDICPVKDKADCESPKLDPTEKFIKCSPGKVVEYQTNKGESWKELSELGCYNEVLEPKGVIGQVAAADILNLRCRTPRKCDIDKYFDADISDCKTKLFCEKPAVDVTNPKLYKCNADYDIKYKVLGYTSEVAEDWKKIDQLKCENDRFVLVENKASTLVAKPDIPLALLCALDKKCDLQYFTSDDDCNADTEVCAKPIAGPSSPDSPYNLTCADPIMALRVKDDLDGAWVMVKYVTCNGEGFTVYREDNQKFDKFVLRIQCVRLTTTTCANPCASRMDCKGDVKLIEPTAWNKPAELHCAEEKKMFIIGNQDEGMLYKYPLTCTGKKKEGMDEWINREGDGNGKCLEATCMKVSLLACIDKLFCKDLWPIQSHCHYHTNDCSMVSIDNYDDITCKGGSQMVVKLPKSGKKLNGSILRCDHMTGKWNYTLMDGSVRVGLHDEGAADAPNVYCQHKSCDPQWLEKLFPVQNQSLCLENYDWCARPALMYNSTRIYECPEDHVTYFWDFAWKEWNQEPENTGKFMCCQSEAHQLLDFGGDVKEQDYSCFGMVEPLERQRPAVKCVRQPTCFEKNPLRSDCEGKPDCDTRDFNDSYKEYTCNVRANWYWHVNGKKHEDQLMDAIFCDNMNSEWVGSGESSVEVKFDTGSNVVCMKTAGSTIIPLTGLALILLAAFQ